MSFGSVSAWKQMQNWYHYQGAVSNYIYGSTNNGSNQADFSSAFTNIIANNFSSKATLAGQEALNRLQSQVQAKASNSSTSKGSPALNASGQSTAVANTATQGQAILSSILGYSTAPSSGSSASSSKSQTPSSKYSAPINPSTGYAYVAQSGTALSSLATVNFLV
jgi:hypothetical protein